MLYTTSELHLRHDMRIIPCPIRSHNLNTSNHIQYFYKEKRYNLYQIPNIEFMIGGLENKVRILCFFPGLIRKVNSIPSSRYLNYLSRKEMELWWNQIVYPALEETFDFQCNKLSQIPQTYDLAEQLSRSKDGTYRLKSYPVQHEFLPKLVKFLRHFANNESLTFGDGYHFQDFFFHIFLKNVKENTAVTESSTGRCSMERFFSEWCPLIPSSINYENLFLDVGIDAWKENTFDGVPYTILWDCNRLQSAFKKASGSKGEIDRWCTTSVVGGIHGEPSNKMKAETQCVYFQAYHREKNMTYDKNGTTFLSEVTPFEAVNYNAQYISALQKVQNALRAGSHNNWSCRLEWRVSVYAANEILKFDGRLVWNT